MTSLNVTARLTETITVKRPASLTAAGDAVLGNAFTCSARVQRGNADVGDALGRKTADSCKLITTTELKVGDLVWLPEDNTADVNKARKLLTAKQNQALDGSIVSYTTET